MDLPAYPDAPPALHAAGWTLTAAGSPAAPPERVQVDLDRAAAMIGPLAAASAASLWSAHLLFPGQPDKVQHALASALVTVLVGQATKNPWLGLVAGLGVSLAKEAIDGTPLNPGGTRDLSLTGDLGADLLGITLGATLPLAF